MSSLGRISVIAFVSLFAAGACSLLAPGDDSFLGGRVARDGAPENPDRAIDVEPDAVQDRPLADAADHFSPQDAAGDGAEAETGADGEDGEDGADAADADGPCTSTTQCSTGRFCTPQGRCRLCSDPSTLPKVADLEFGTPEPLAAINNAAGFNNVHRPRVLDGNKLFYELQLIESQIFLTPDWTKTPGSALRAPIDAPNLTESGALSFKPTIGHLAAYNFFYSGRVQRGEEQPYELFGATIDPEGYAPVVVRLPAPFNSDPTLLRSNFTLALSQNRAVWATSDGGLLVQLVTARLNEPSASVMLLPDANNCVFNQLDWSPWLSPDGRILFFNARERTPDCQAMGDFPGDIYVVELDEAGNPLGPSVALKGVSKLGTEELDGSLSPDQCWLYYTHITPDGLRAVRAPRVR